MTNKEWNKIQASGRVRLTVAGQYYSFSSQWSVTDCLCYTPKHCQGGKHQCPTRPRPSALSFLQLTSSFSYQCYIISSILVTALSSSDIFWWRWSITAPCVGWCHILHYEVKQTLLRADGEILPPAGGGQDCYIYSERLTGGVGRGWEAGGRAIRARLKVRVLDFWLR